MNVYRWRRGKRDAREQRQAAEVAGEAEAFLTGKTAAWLDHHGRPVPPWAWVNGLAHATLDDLVSADRLSWNKRASRRWANGFLLPLSAELASRCRGDDRSLAELQRRFLWPLERRLARPRAPSAREVQELSALVRTALGWGAGRTGALPGGYPAAPVGRGLGHGRINRIALSLLGPASVARRPLLPPIPPSPPPVPPEA